MASSSLEAAAPAALTPVLGSHHALTWRHFVVCAAYCAALLLAGNLPLTSSPGPETPAAGDTWNHLRLGDWILREQALPSTDPLLPLASGVDFTPVSWLGDVVLASLMRWGGGMDTRAAAAESPAPLGIALLSSLAAGCFLLTSLLLGRLAFNAVGRKRAVLAVVVVCVAFGWEWLGSATPLWLGMTLLAILMWRLAPYADRYGRPNPGEVEAALASTDLKTWGQAPAVSGWRTLSWPLRIGVPLAFGLWANLDGSFLIGLVWLACLAVGVGVESVRRESSLASIGRDPICREWIWLLEASLLATLLHPLGLELWRQAFRGGQSPFWLAAGGWQPTVLASAAGLAIVAAWAVALTAWIRSSRRVHSSDVLILVAFTVLTACNRHLAIWLAPAAIWSASPYLASVVAAASPSPSPSSSAAADDRPLNALRFAGTLACGLLIWSAFCLSPWSAPVLGGKARSSMQTAGPQLPWGAAGWIHEHGWGPESSVTSTPRKPLVWAPDDWSGWLALQCQEKVAFVSRPGAVHLPRQVRSDHVRLWNGDGWSEVADRYALQAIVVDKRRQPRMTAAAQRAGNPWRLVYEDDQALILQRRSP